MKRAVESHRPPGSENTELIVLCSMWSLAAREVAKPSRTELKDRDFVAEGEELGSNLLHVAQSSLWVWARPERDARRFYEIQRRSVPTTPNWVVS
jgi:hypothetical protein